ncbi:MAG: ATP-binding protein [Rhodobacter sp.]|nr:ATP-binding protein [Rhodobacter sp.]
MNDRQRAELEAFIAQTEGEPPPVFVGRKAVLDDVRTAASQVWKGEAAKAHGASKATRVVQGAPGAGKSSVLAEMLKRSLRNEEAARVVVMGSDAVKESISGVLDLVYETSRIPRSEWVERGREFLKLSRSQVQSVNIAGFGGSLVARNFAGLQALSRHHPPRGWRHPVILAIDEAQSLTPGHIPPPAINVLQGLHGGAAGLPITLVLAGLGDTVAVANNIGLTRIPSGQIHNIGSFRQFDIAALRVGFGEKFGIPLKHLPPDGMRMIDDCEGWPRHLHHVLRAVGKAALEVDGDLGKVNWAAASEYAADLRMGYYRQQFSPEMKAAVNLTAAVMRALDSTDTHSKILTLMETLHKTDSMHYRFPARDWDANGFFMHLVHKGALHEQEEDRFVCPIPSFRSHLLERGGQAFAGP